MSFGKSSFILLSILVLSLSFHQSCCYGVDFVSFPSEKLGLCDIDVGKLGDVMFVVLTLAVSVFPDMLVWVMADKATGKGNW